MKMLAQRLYRHIPVYSSSVPSRSFASSSHILSAVRSPGLGDITPNDTESFFARQKVFRDNLEAARKRKEQADSQSLATSAPASPTTQKNGAQSSGSGDGSSPVSPDGAANQMHEAALGSLATHRIVGDARKAEQDAVLSKRKGGALSNLIYGTAEGQQMDKDMERSFSQLLARGKYVHSIVFHDVKPDKVDEYVQLVGSWYPRMASMPENKVNLVGSWRSEVGDCDTFGSYDTPTRTHVLTLIRE